MELRTFGKRSGFNVPAANIGAMRFPADMDEAIALIRHAIDSGMKYIDTSRGYGDSELKLGQALKDGYREKVILSTKWSPWVVKIEETDDSSADCMRRRIEESMKRLDVDYLDFYQVWSVCNREHWQQATEKGGMLDGILKAREEGLVGHLGFTTHDSVENLISYLPEADWAEAVLFTYNLANPAYEAAIKAYHEAGIATIIMNPVGGGRFREESHVLMELARRVGTRSVADLAIRYVVSNSNVDAIVSGISRTSDVDDSIASCAMPAFTAEEMAEIRTVTSSIAERAAAFCTGCKYCMPCPQGINIPAVMTALFEDRAWGMTQGARERYAGIQGPRADACAECGECEPKCTQKLSIIEEMREAVRLLS